jgi:hypothetical protein
VNFHSKFLGILRWNFVKKLTKKWQPKTNKKDKKRLVAMRIRTESSKNQRLKFKFEKKKTVKKFSKPPGVSISHQTQPNQKFQIRFK